MELFPSPFTHDLPLFVAALHPEEQNFCHALLGSKNTPHAWH
jgi:hypothetical protein